MNNVLQSELKIVSKNVGLSAIYFGIGYPLSIIVGIVIAKIVGAENLGIITLGLSLSQLLAFFSLLGTDRGLIKYIAHFLGINNNTNISRVIKFSILCSLSISIVIIVLYFQFDYEINQILFPKIPNISIITNYFVILLPVIVLRNILKGSLGGIQKPQYDKVQQKIIFPISRIVLLLIFFQFFSLITSLLLATIISIVIGTGYLLYIMRREIKAIEIFNNSYSEMLHFKEFILFSLPLILIPLFDLATHSIDTLIVGHYLSAADTGVYTIIRKFGFFVAIPLSLFTSMIAASAAKMFATNHSKEFEKIYQYATKWIVFFSSIIFSIIFVFSQEILNLIGKDFVPGSIPLKIFLFSQLINASVGPTGNTLLMTDNRNIFIINSFISVTIGIASAFYLIPQYGLIGAAISISIAFSLVNLLCVFFVIRNLKINPMKYSDLLRRMLAIVTAILVNHFLFNVLHYLNNSDLIRVFIGSLFTIIIISFFYIFIEKLENEDKYILKRMLKKIGICETNFNLYKKSTKNY